MSEIPLFAFRTHHFSRTDDGLLVEFERYTDTGKDRIVLFFSAELCRAINAATPQTGVSADAKTDSDRDNAE